MRLKQIRTLTICNRYVVNNRYIASRICRIFPCVKQLHVSVEQADDMIVLIDGLKHLSSASFVFKSLSDNDKQNLWQKAETIINGVYRLQDSYLHILIKNRVNILHRKVIPSISWMQRLENNWYHLDLMLSQESLLSIFITIILIAHLHNIVIHMWIYMMSSMAWHSFIYSFIFGSASTLYISPIGSIFSKHLDRPST
ncbi:unnamed protein product, partial [Rotaria sordida]